MASALLQGVDCCLGRRLVAASSLGCFSCQRQRALAPQPSANGFSGRRCGPATAVTAALAPVAWLVLRAAPFA
ncbi:MAG: hypothetical protein EBR68_01720 [Synechococcaceae bacterium WB4_2_0811]|nr:hypothetical protein [Synechococcaceae bacterium WB4_2_0811]